MKVPEPSRSPDAAASSDTALDTTILAYLGNERHFKAPPRGERMSAPMQKHRDITLERFDKMLSPLYW